LGGPGWNTVRAQFGQTLEDSNVRRFSLEKQASESQTFPEVTFRLSKFPFSPLGHVLKYKSLPCVAKH